MHVDEDLSFLLTGQGEVGSAKRYQMAEYPDCTLRLQELMGSRPSSQPLDLRMQLICWLSEKGPSGKGGLLRTGQVSLAWPGSIRQ